MKFSVVMPNYNGARFLEATVQSILAQREPGVDLEFIVVDGASTDGSLALLERYRPECAHFISEPDRGAASAINKGLRLATGDVIAWLNSDDLYEPGALRRVAACLVRHPRKALCFGHCPIINEGGQEIRRGITRFKECFFPFSCRFAIQSINYISQPAMFFRRSALQAAGGLCEDLKTAWDYDLILRLWRQGGGAWVRGAPLARFRWHPGTLSGQHFRRQFEEELQAAIADAGRWSLQALLHRGVRWGIVTIYSRMNRGSRCQGQESRGGGELRGRV